MHTYLLAFNADLVHTEGKVRRNFSPRDSAEGQEVLHSQLFLWQHTRLYLPPAAVNTYVSVQFKRSPVL